MSFATLRLAPEADPAAQKHFEDTIQRQRTVDEVRRFLPSQEIENLNGIYHSSNFIVWGAVPGPMNELRWEKMTPGDVVLIYKNGRIRFAGEIAAKVRNAELARYFWKENETGGTWELMYFIVNEERRDEIDYSEFCGRGRLRRQCSGAACS